MIIKPYNTLNTRKNSNLKQINFTDNKTSQASIISNQSLPANDKKALKTGITSASCLLAGTVLFKILNKISNTAMLGIPLTIGTILYYNERVKPKVKSNLTDYYIKSNEQNHLQRGARGTKLFTITKEIASIMIKDCNNIFNHK